MNQQLLENNIQKIIQLHSSGNTDEAISKIKLLIESNPSEAILFNICGVLMKEIGEYEDALSYLDKSIVLKPNYAEAYYNKGITFQELNQIDSAINSYKLAIKYNPKYPEAHNNLGALIKNSRQFEESINYFKKAIEIEPNFVAAWNNLGNAYKDVDLLSDAINCYEKAIKINSKIPELHNNKGNALKELGRYDKAIVSYKKSLDIEPENYETLNNLGVVFDKLGHFNQAIDAYDKAIKINPEFSKGFYNRGQVLNNLQKLPEALASFELAYKLEPGIDFIYGDLLHLKMFLCIWDKFEMHLEELSNKIWAGQKAVNPFPMLALIDDLELQRKVAEIYINKDYSVKNVKELNPYVNHTKIIVGYFSPDFRDHAVSHLSAGMFELHNREKFEIHAFYFGEDAKDKINLRIQEGVDYFHNVQSMSDDEIISISRSLEIDIAIDLCGYTQNSRRELFANRLAPIQVNYLGYTATTGAHYMDYIVADSTIISDSSQYTEKIVYMPNSYMVNDTIGENYDRVFTRKEVGLPDQGFIFCCFNNHYKILPKVFESWMRILNEVEDSVLWLAETNEFTTQNLIKEAQKYGIHKNRIIFAPQMTLREDHLNRIKLADLFLDTSPFNAHTTASDALRMGIPLLTCIGESFVSRVAASLLNSLNLNELVVDNIQDYESMAIMLAKNVNKIQIIKEKLQKNLITETLFNTSLFTKNIESAYTKMYERSNNGLEPDDIKVAG